MGATEWMYFTEYDDPERALQRLRDEVFRDGRFRRPWEFPDLFSHVRTVPNLSLKSRLTLWAVESVFTTIELVRWALWGFRTPATVEQAVEWAGEDGTHSILDVERTGMYRAGGTAIPLSEPRLRDLFGTTEPTRDAVEDGVGEVAAALARWEAVYITVYHDGRPSHLAFVGVSGD